MILNGKAKELFLEWSKTQTDLQIGVQNTNGIGGFLIHLNNNIEALPNRLSYPFIIEWLDSVGVYVFANRAFAFEEWNFEILGHFTSGFKYESRQEATTEAIKKANELINHEPTL